MTGYDVFVILALLASGAAGWFRGGMREITALFSFLLAALLALITLPWTAPVALGLIGWLWMYDSVFSPIDWLLRQVGLLGHPGALLGPLPNLYWLGSKQLALPSVVIVNVWRLLPLQAATRRPKQLPRPCWRASAAPSCWVMLQPTMHTLPSCWPWPSGWARTPVPWLVS